MDEKAISASWLVLVIQQNAELIDHSQSTKSSWRQKASTTGSVTDGESTNLKSPLPKNTTLIASTQILSFQLHRLDLFDQTSRWMKDIMYLPKKL